MPKYILTYDKDTHKYSIFEYHEYLKYYVWFTEYSDEEIARTRLTKYMSYSDAIIENK